MIIWMERKWQAVSDKSIMGTRHYGDLAVLLSNYCDWESTRILHLRGCSHGEVRGNDEPQICQSSLGFKSRSRTKIFKLKCGSDDLDCYEVLDTLTGMTMVTDNELSKVYNSCTPYSKYRVHVHTSYEKTTFSTSNPQVVVEASGPLLPGTWCLQQRAACTLNHQL